MAPIAPVRPWRPWRPVRRHGAVGSRRRIREGPRRRDEAHRRRRHARLPRVANHHRRRRHARLPRHPARWRRHPRHPTWWRRRTRHVLFSRSGAAPLSLSVVLGWRKSRRRGGYEATIDALLLIPIYFLVEWILCLVCSQSKSSFFPCFLSSFFSLFCEIHRQSHFTRAGGRTPSKGPALLFLPRSGVGGGKFGEIIRRGSLTRRGIPTLLWKSRP